MNALQWHVGLPLAAALLILLVRRWPVICALLAGAALVASALMAAAADPAGQALEMLGQALSLTPAAARNVGYAYVLVGIACVASLRRGQDGLLYGFVLGSAALTVTALAARGHEIMAFSGGAALLSLALAAPLVCPSLGRQGVRTIPVLALMPLLLLVPFWVLAAQRVPPTDQTTIQTASIVAVIAAGLLLGVFPLHLWRSTLHTLGHPALLLAVATLGSLLGLNYMGRLMQNPAWPRFWELARPLLLYGGALTVLVAGLMSIVHSSKREVVGYASLAYWGGTIVQLGQALPDPSSTATLDLWLGAVALLAASCALWCQADDDETGADLCRVSKIRSVSQVALIVGIYTLSGLPLAASFPVRIAGLYQVAAEDTAVGLMLLVGSGAVAWGALRMALPSTTANAAEPERRLLDLLPCSVALLLALLLCLAFLFPALLRAMPSTWFPSLLAL